MTNELDALEAKVAQVVALCHSLRAENTRLRQQLANAANERKDLVDRMEAARVRIEQLAGQLPDAKGADKS